MDLPGFPHGSFAWVCLAAPFVVLAFGLLLLKLTSRVTDGCATTPPLPSTLQGPSLLRPVRRASAAEVLAGDGTAPAPRPVSTCPYCKADMIAREPEGIMRCPSCKTVHHAPCWRENGGCTIHGCKRSSRGKSEQAHDAPGA